MFSGNSLGFIHACEELNWNHERSTPRRSETHGIAEGAVRRVKEGTSSVLVQSGLQANWWAEAMHGVSLLSPKCARPTGRWPPVNVGSIHHLKGRIFHLKQK